MVQALFSDGKLNTLVKDKFGRNRFVLETFVKFGAPEEILWESKPHIGTDILIEVVERMREEIIRLGGEFLFHSQVTDILPKENCLIVNGCHRIETDAAVFAVGHSARDTFKMLDSKDIMMEPKSFAVGLRIMHTQEFINENAYGKCEYKLPTADYKVTYKSVSTGKERGVYSFCMCPGGFIVPAMTDAAESVVNGMSPSGRNSVFANSGLVTEVRLADFEHLRAEWGELAGLKFQQQFERLARQQGGEHQIAPAQRVADFVAGCASGSLSRTSYIPGVVPSRLDKWMPGFIASSLRAGIATFGRRMRGFLTNEALVVGVESRTSTPVRIPRDAQTLMHPEVAGLFPAGEGAGYAGGIISAALDGERIADAVVNYLKNAYG